MYFTKDHEWVSIDGDVATIGVTEYAVHQLGDVVFAETPEAGRIIAKGDAFAVVESVKAASDIYAPVAGEVIEGNDALAGNPALVNDAPEGDGWFAKVRLSHPSDVEGLMDRAAYDAFIATL